MQSENGKPIIIGGHGGGVDAAILRDRHHAGIILIQPPEQTNQSTKEENLIHVNELLADVGIIHSSAGETATN